MDASSLVELLRGSPVGGVVMGRIDDAHGEVHLPHLAVSEVASALRSLAARGELRHAHAGALLAELVAMPGVRHPAEPLLSRAWELRDDISMYDAHYVALAEALDAPLVTCDGRLARSTGHLAVIELVGAET